MKALVEKEIRLMLPAFAAAIVLATIPLWLFAYDVYWYGNSYPIHFFCLGVALLALSTFGREVGMKTLPFMLAQPMERARVWRTKLTVLGIFISITLVGWWLSRVLFSRFYVPQHLPLPNVRGFVGPVPQWRLEQGLVEFCILIPVMVAGALWTTLLLRQVAAALCLTLLLPMVIGVPVLAAGGGDWVVSTILGIYAVGGILFAHRQFAGLQDTAWTGGIVTLATGRAVTEGESLRERRPWGTLLRKELKLQEFTLAGMAGLFVVHVGVVFLRKLGADSFGRTTMSTLEMFGVVWLFVPLVAGSQSVAEERQLGILDGLLCLPFSRRVQFWIKLLFVLFIGGVLSTSLEFAVEKISQVIGAGKASGFASTNMEFVPSLLWFLVLSIAAFWASTLTRSVVQAMAAGVVISLLFFGLFQLSFQVPILWRIVAFPTLLVAILWLAYGNFRLVFESGRRWRKNVFGVSGIVVISLVLTYAANYRIWEFVLPVDGAHGPARLLGYPKWEVPETVPLWPKKIPRSKPLAIHGYGGTGLAVVLPNGRLWTDRIGGEHGWVSLSGDQFQPGSNWVDGYENSRDTVAIRSDGTLWASERTYQRWVDGKLPAPESPIPLVRIGNDNDWKSVTRYPTLLLKRDGTLWSWGTGDTDNKNYPGIQSFTPKKIETSSNWDRIFQGEHGIYGWKRDGTAWAVQYWFSETNRSDVRLAALDNFHVHNFNSCPCSEDIELCVRDDGTLWFWWLPDFRRQQSIGLEVGQIGKDADWAAVAGGINQVVGLKNDGSLWSWNLVREWRQQWRTLSNYFMQEVPQRIGVHNDWVGLGCWSGQSVALAADGTFWQLPGIGVPVSWRYPGEPLLRPSRRMSKIENIFGAKE